MESNPLPSKHGVIGATSKALDSVFDLPPTLVTLLKMLSFGSSQVENATFVIPTSLKDVELY